jgi:hypothetical protein
MECTAIRTVTAQLMSLGKEKAKMFVAFAPKYAKPVAKSAANTTPNTARNVQRPAASARKSAGEWQPEQSDRLQKSMLPKQERL